MTLTKLYIALMLVISPGAGISMAYWYSWSGSGDHSLSPFAECRSHVSFIGWSARSRPEAETRALIGWTRHAQQLGSRFANWHNARRRKMECHEITGYGQKCTISAFPCPSKTVTAKRPRVLF
jgi:hypothetical protein